MGYNVYIPLLTRQMNDVAKNLNPAVFDVPDSTFIFCKLQRAWNGHAPHYSVSKIVASRITNNSLFVLTNFEIKYLPQHLIKVKDKNTTPNK